MSRAAARIVFSVLLSISIYCSETMLSILFFVLEPCTLIPSLSNHHSWITAASALTWKYRSQELLSSVFLSQNPSLQVRKLIWLPLYCLGPEGTAQQPGQSAKAETRRYSKDASVQRTNNAVIHRCCDRGEPESESVSVSLLASLRCSQSRLVNRSLVLSQRWLSWYVMHILSQCVV
jgi:hypothetical protein